MVALKDLVFINLVALAANGASVPRASQKVQSLLDPNISLSFKETHICETTPGVKSYSGYVNLPANAAEGRPYDVHTFFWFFERRQECTSVTLAPGRTRLPLHPRRPRRERAMLSDARLRRHGAQSVVVE